MGELNIYQKASAGQKFKPRHETWNAFIEAAEANQRRNDAGDQGELNLRYDETNRVRGKNETGAGLTKGSIVGVDAPIFDPSVHPNTFDQTVGFEFVTPSLPDHQRAFGVLLEDIPAEGIGRVAVGGLVWCQVALAAGVNAAIPADSNTGYLVSSEEGYPIVWRPAAGVIEWCLVLLSAPHQTSLTIVEVYDAGKGDGDPVSGDGSCVFPGRVLTFSSANCAGGGWDTGASCWIFPVDDPTGSIPNRSRFIAKDEGTLDIGGDERTLYEVARGSLAGNAGVVRFETTEAKVYGTNCDAETVEWTGAAYAKTGTAINVIDTFGIWGPAPTASSGFAVTQSDRPEVDALPAYEILWMESYARFIKFTLTANIVSQAATATVNDFWGDAHNGMTPGASVTVTDSIQAFGLGETGDQGIAIYNEQDESYRITSLNIPLCRQIHAMLVIPDDSADYAAVFSNTGGSITCVKELIEECPP